MPSKEILVKNKNISDDIWKKVLLYVNDKQNILYHDFYIQVLDDNYKQISFEDNVFIDYGKMINIENVIGQFIIKEIIGNDIKMEIVYIQSYKGVIIDEYINNDNLRCCLICDDNKNIHYLTWNLKLDKKE